MNQVHFRTTLQQLADGELDHRQRSQFLRSIPVDSKYWRELALAFVERQILDESLRGDELAPAMENGDRGASSVELGLPICPAASRLHKTSSPPIRLRRPLSLIALAACLLIGISIGSWMATRGGTERMVGKPSQQSPVFDPHAAQPALETASDEGIPLADALSRVAYPIPVELRRDLMKQGYLITELDRLSKVQLPTGQLVEMPVRQVAVTYLGTAVYQ